MISDSSLWLSLIGCMSIYPSVDCCHSNHSLVTRPPYHASLRLTESILASRLSEKEVSLEKLANVFGIL